MASVWILISLVATHYWPLHKLKIKMHRFMEFLTKRYIWSNHLSLLLKESLKMCEIEEVLIWIETVTKSLVWTVCISYSRVWSFSVSHAQKDHSVFLSASQKENTFGDICIWHCDQGNDVQGITDIKQSQKKTLDLFAWVLKWQYWRNKSLLSEAGLLGCKILYKPMKTNAMLLPN